MVWAVPTTRIDGATLSASDLKGYEVYYTNDTGSVSATVPVSGGSTLSALVSNLTTGNYYFSVAAIDKLGDKSALSTLATVSVP